MNREKNYFFVSRRRSRLCGPIFLSVLFKKMFFTRKHLDADCTKWIFSHSCVWRFATHERLYKPYIVRPCLSFPAFLPQNGRNCQSKFWWCVIGQVLNQNREQWRIKIVIARKRITLHSLPPYLLNVLHHLLLLPIHLPRSPKLHIWSIQLLLLCIYIWIYIMVMYSRPIL